MNSIQILKKYIQDQDIYLIKEINPKDLVFCQKVRDACMHNKCGRYNQHFMCPPHISDIDSFLSKGQYQRGFLILVKDQVDEKGGLEAFYKSADKLHKIMLDVERKGKDLGFYNAFSFIGGHCRLCKTCGAVLGKDACIDTHRARPSLEAVGVDVIDICSKQNILIEFKKEEVTWVGCLVI